VTGFVCSLDGEFYYTEGECSQNCKAIANCEGAYRCDINNGVFFDEDECKENCRINGNCLSIDEHIRGGVIQNHSQGEYSEDYAMELNSVPLEMTFEKIGFFRDIHFKLGYESHRHPDWLEGNYNCIWKDTGIIPNFCTEGQVETDDGCFRQIAHLCPDDHYEIPDAGIQGTSNDKQWWCYRFVEDASCWEDDETQFGNGCYILASPAHPTICPSGSTLIPWPEQNYMCLFQQNPFTDPYCPPGQQAYEGNCYYTATPTCPSGWTRNGGICEKTEDACPQGYDYILFNVICRSGNTFADPSDGTCNGCPAGYSCLTKQIMRSVTSRLPHHPHVPLDNMNITTFAFIHQLLPVVLAAAEMEVPVTAPRVRAPLVMTTLQIWIFVISGHRLPVCPVIPGTVQVVSAKNTRRHNVPAVKERMTPKPERQDAISLRDIFIVEPRILMTPARMETWYSTRMIVTVSQSQIVII